MSVFNQMTEITSHQENVTHLTPEDQLIPQTGDVDADGWNIYKVQRILDEIRNQPRWRQVADRECAYYDGNQLDADVIEELANRGQPPSIDNLIQPTINAVLGMQAKTRVDTKVEPEAGETNNDVAEALSIEVKHHADSARANRAKSDAYAEQIKVGISWVEVAFNSDPFKPKIRYEHIHRREMYFDWRAKKPDYSDGRYLVRRQWYDQDVLMEAFPEQRDWIRNAMSERAGWDMDLTGFSQLTQRNDDFDASTGFTMTTEQYEWMNVTRRRLMVYEVWYKVHETGMIIKMPNGKIMEFDDKDPLHQAIAQSGAVQPEKATFDKVRVAYYIGPRLVGDYASPYKHRHFPYVPFFGFREDATGIPYGLIRAMMSPQDEINARKSKMYWLLSAKRVIATEEAVEDHAVAAQEIARPDAYIIKRNKPGESFEVQENGQMATQQFQVMQAAKEAIQTNVGVHNATLGRDSGATSGLAINSLVEQDAVTLADINDNFNMAARQADEILLELVIQLLSDMPNHEVTVTDDNGDDRIVVLNQMMQTIQQQDPNTGQVINVQQPIIDPKTGQPTILNDISHINCNVVLADTASTPTFRNQQLVQITELVKSLPGNVQAMLMPFVINATDLPYRKEMADMVRNGLGLGDGGQDPQVAQLQAQIQQLQQKLDAKQPPELLAAQVEKMKAEIEKIKADTVETSSKGLYEMIQTAMAAAANPAIVPIADSIGKSVGFVDKNGGGIEDGQQIAQQQGQSIDANPQTNPNIPATPQDPAQGLPPQMQPSPQAPSPAQGVASGIEQQGNQITQQ
jgi:hypothetical protein